MTQQTTITMTEDKAKAIKGFLQEWSNSVVREEGEKQFRKDAVARIEKQLDMSKEQIKNLISRHMKEEQHLKKLRELEEAVEMYSMLYPQQDEE